MNRLFFVLALCGSATGLSAQQVPQPQAPQPSAAQDGRQQGSAQPYALSLDDALSFAQRYNPDYLQAVNNRKSAGAAQRAAYGGLLPQIAASLSGQLQQGGRQVVGGTELGASSDVLQSSYNIGVSYQLSKSTFVTPRLQRANSAAVEAEIMGATETLRANVRQQYLSVLQSQARLSLQDTLIENAQAQLELAKGRSAVGAGTLLDVQRAEVSLGQQRVQRLRAQNQFDIDKLRLFQLLGIPQPQNVVLTTTFPTLETVPALYDLLEMAKRQNPNVNALRSREQVASLNVSRTRGEYLPTLSLSTGIGGYTYQYRDSNFPVAQAQGQLESARNSCLRIEEARAKLLLANTYNECNQIVFTPQQAASIRAANSRFPFNFTNAPKSFSAQLSLPIFDGFAREQRLQEATIQRDNAQQSVRSRELALTADVTAAYLTLQTARQTILLQDENSAKARQELSFTQEQYSVGLATFVDLTTSRASFAQAESDRINAIYEYHKSFSSLESAVGRSLR